MRDLLHVIRKKRSALFDIFHQDVAPCHISEQTVRTGCVKFSASPFRDLQPRFNTFRLSCSPIWSRSYGDIDSKTYNKLQIETSSVEQFEKSWFESVYDKWVARHHKCIEHHEEYLEKEQLVC